MLHLNNERSLEKEPLDTVPAHFRNDTQCEACLFVLFRHGEVHVWRCVLSPATSFSAADNSHTHRITRNLRVGFLLDDNGTVLGLRVQLFVVTLTHKLVYETTRDLVETLQQENAFTSSKRSKTRSHAIRGAL